MSKTRYIVICITGKSVSNIWLFIAKITEYFLPVCKVAADLSIVRKHCISKFIEALRGLCCDCSPLVMTCSLFYGFVDFCIYKMCCLLCAALDGPDDPVTISAVCTLSDINEDVQQLTLPYGIPVPVKTPPTTLSK